MTQTNRDMLVKALTEGKTLKVVQSFTDKGKFSEQEFFRGERYTLKGVALPGLVVLRNARTEESRPINERILTAENFIVVEA